MNVKDLPAKFHISADRRNMSARPIMIEDYQKNFTRKFITKRIFTKTAFLTSFVFIIKYVENYEIHVFNYKPKVY